MQPQNEPAEPLTNKDPLPQPASNPIVIQPNQAPSVHNDAPPAPATLAPAPQQTFQPTGTAQPAQSPIVDDIVPPVSGFQNSVVPADSTAPEQESPKGGVKVFSSGTYGTLSTTNDANATGQKLPKKRSKKRWLGAGALVALILLSATAYGFFVYLPNTPDNVWATGLTHTGEQLDAAITKLNEPAVRESLSKNKIHVEGEVKFPDIDADINFDSAYDEKKSDSKLSLNVNATDGSSEKLDIDAAVKSELPDNATWPNVFVKLSGFAPLIERSPIERFSKYDNKWIAFDQAFYNQYLPDNKSETSTDNRNPTQEDYSSIARDALSVSNEFVFTTDPEKAIIVRDSYEGKEESEGVDTFHFKASINEDNATKYCEALAEKMVSNRAFQKLTRSTEQKLKDDLDQTKKSCQRSKNQEKEQEKTTFDLWIDKKYKLLHKIRITDDLEQKAQELRKEKAKCEQRQTDRGTPTEFITDMCGYYDNRIETGESYFEFGQVYGGGDELKLFINGKQDTNKTKANLRFDATVNTASLKIDGKITFKDESKDNPGTVEVKLNSEQQQEEIDANSPEGAIPVQQVIKELEDSQSGATDRQRLGVNSNNELDSNGGGLLDTFEALLRTLRQSAESPNN